jgi:hypothetical protein
MEAAKCFMVYEKDGRGERIRTSDPLVPNQVLYQAEPLPELGWREPHTFCCGLVHIVSQRALV